MERNLLEVPKGKSKWIRVGKLLDGLNQPIQNAHLVYNHGQILHASKETPPKELVNKDQTTPDLDLPDFIILPGLIEAHAHLFLEGGELNFEKRKKYLENNPDWFLDQAKNRLEKLVSLGIVGYRDAGDKLGVGLALSRMYENKNGKIMPYVDSPGAAIHHLGRYGTFMADPLEDHDSISECIQDRIRKGADRIKLIPTGIINFKQGKVTKEPQMTTQEIIELVETSKLYRKQTFAHASGYEGIDRVIDGGADSVEHGYFIREDQLSRMRDQQVAWVPTFAPVQKQVDHADRIGWEDLIKKNLQNVLDGHAKSLRQAHEKGVIVIAGSDAGSMGVAHGKDFYYELELMERAGFDSLSVINSATGVSSSRLEYKELFGMLKPGYKSRFIVTKNSPLDTVSNLRKHKYVFYDGHVLESNENTDTSGL